MFPAITFDHSFSPRRLGALLALSSAVMLPLAVSGLTAPAAAQAPAENVLTLIPVPIKSPMRRDSPAAAASP